MNFNWNLSLYTVYIYVINIQPWIKFISKERDYLKKKCLLLKCIVFIIRLWNYSFTYLISTFILTSLIFILFFLAFYYNYHPINLQYGWWQFGKFIVYICIQSDCWKVFDLTLFPKLVFQWPHIRILIFEMGFLHILTLYSLLLYWVIQCDCFNKWDKIVFIYI